MSYDRNIQKTTEQVESEKKQIQTKAKDTKETLKNYLDNAIAQKLVKLTEDKKATFLARFSLAAQKTPTLMNCTPTSIAECVLKCLELGIEPFSASQFCAIIPYKDSKTNVTEATLQIQYQGMRHLLMKHMGDKVLGYGYEAVYENDTVDSNLGTLEFKKSYGTNRGEIIGYLGYVKMNNGFVHDVYMTKSEMDSWVDRYCLAYDFNTKKKTKKPKTWVEFYEQMACKTVFKRVLRKLDLSQELAEVISADDMLDVNMVDVTPKSNDLPMPQGAVVHMDDKFMASTDDTATDDLDEVMVEISQCSTVEELSTVAEKYKDADNFNEIQGWINSQRELLGKQGAYKDCQQF